MVVYAQVKGEVAVMEHLKRLELLGQAQRMALLQAMRTRDITAHEAAEIMQMSASAASYQLRMLSEQGLIVGQRSDADGRTIYYRLQWGAFREVIGELSADFGQPPGIKSGSVVAFLCRANSARSQMAEAWARKYAPADITVVSAGVEPSRMHPMTVTVMAEVGIDVHEQYAKQFVELDVMPTHVISVCDYARPFVEAYFTTQQRQHWSIADPARRADIADFRDARDEIERRVSEWSRGMSA
jgi:protein-tyrosine-phosphatase